MEREKLESYQSMKAEIEELQHKIEHMYEDDSMFSNSVINDYRTGYPIPQAIVTIDKQKYWKKRDKYINKLEELKKACEDVEEYVESIQDSKLRRIFRMTYLEGKTQKEVGSIIHMDRSQISRRITKFFQNYEKRS